RVLLSEGTFTLSAPVVIDDNYVTLQGLGWRATELRPATGVDPAQLILVGSAANIEYAAVLDMFLNGRTDAEAHAAGDGLTFHSNGGVVRNLWIQRMAGDGVNVNGFGGADVFENLFENVIVNKPQGDCFYIGSDCGDAELIRCIAIGGNQEGPPFGDYGFYVWGFNIKLLLCHAYYQQLAGLRTGNAGQERIQVIGGHYETCAQGLKIDAQSIANIIGIKASNNTSQDILIQGGSTFVTITNCVLRSASGQNIYFDNADYCVLTGNVCIAATVNSIRVDASSNYNVIVGNQVDEVIRLDTATNIVRDNMGFITENSGTGSIASGTTADVIAHGLDVTPTVDDISITLAENPTADPGNIWVDTIGAANFTVRCRVNPGVSNLDFGWRVAALYP
ncbi:unnamed protein product, partial [marine sediment metagenome]